MPKDYSYDYEWDKEYCYPESNVLINKFGIQDQETWESLEREITSFKIFDAQENLIKGHFDLQHLQKIHTFIFGDIYSWAGELRHVNIAKGNQFCLSHNILQYSSDLFNKLYDEHYLIDASSDAPYRLAYYLSEINVLHPFREGNGRAQRVFIEYLAKVSGYEVDFSGVSAGEMIVASANSFACDYGKIHEMFERITTKISYTEQQNYIKTFFGSQSEAMSWFEDHTDQSEGQSFHLKF